MHYGFAMPLLSIPFVAITVLFVPDTIGTAIVGLWVGGFILGGAFAKWRATGQIRRWARERGISNISKLPRGGFVSWAFTFWTFAEMDWYRGNDSRGETRKFIASYMAFPFGLLVTTFCEEEPVNETEQPFR